MQQKLERYLQLCGNMLLPCFWFVLTLFTYLLNDDWGYEQASLFHQFYLGINVVLMLILLNFNQGRGAFFSLVVLLAYLGINYLKKNYGADYINSAYYNNAIILLSLNMLFFYLYPPQHFVDKRSLYYVVMVLIEYSIFEFVSKYNLSLNWRFYGVNIAAVVALGVLVITAFFRAISYGALYDYSILFASLAIVLGLYLGSDALGFSSFFLCFGVIELSMTIYCLSYSYFFDDDTGLYNRNSYLRQARDFPPKYSLGVLSVDSFVNLNKALSKRQKNELFNLLIDILQESIDENMIVYRYTSDKLIVFGEQLTLKEMREYLENFRRNVAGTEFALHKHPTSIRITISGGVAEKKRVDANAEVVLARAEKVMYETLKFTGNVISPLPKGMTR